MSEIESRVKARVRKNGIQAAILQTIALVGVLSVAALAPNMMKLVPRDVVTRISGKHRGTRDVTISRLIRAGYLVREQTGGFAALRITTKGRAYLEGIAGQKIPRPTTWDKKWRVIIFDIRERHRKIRDALRSELQAQGFYKMQDSVWVFPFPCEDFVSLLKADLKVGKDILYLVVEEIENDRGLRAHFNLS